MTRTGPPDVQEACRSAPDFSHQAEQPIRPPTEQSSDRIHPDRIMHQTVQKRMVVQVHRDSLRITLSFPGQDGKHRRPGNLEIILVALRFVPLPLYLIPPDRSPVSPSVTYNPKSDRIVREGGWGDVL